MQRISFGYTIITNVASASIAHKKGIEHRKEVKKLDKDYDFNPNSYQDFITERLWKGSKLQGQLLIDWIFFCDIPVKFNFSFW